jgi:hypothetical protein
MSKEELIAKAKTSRVDFNGNVPMDGNWNGESYDGYYAQYADKDGVHACPCGQEEYVNDFEPYGFDEINESTYTCLINDIIK